MAPAAPQASSPGSAPLAARRFAWAAVLALVLAVTGWSLRRAATQSITHDEALTYEVYVARPWSSVYREYRANDHVLYTLLAKLSVGALGASELALRLPSVLSGLLFLVLLARLARRALGPGLAWPATVAAIALDPFVLDYLSAARGYGLAAALFTGALLGCHAALDRRRSPRPALLAAGLCAGLSVAANLVFLFPVLGLGAVLVLLLLLEPRVSAGAGAAPPPLALALLAAAPAVGAVLVLLGPLYGSVDAKRYTFGSESLEGSAVELVRIALRHDAIGLPGVVDAPWLALLVRVLAHGLVPLALAAIAWSAARAVVRVARARPDGALDPRERLLVLAGGGLLVTLALHACAHLVFATPYPRSRAALHLVLLLSLAVAALLAGPQPFRAPSRLARSAALVVVAALVLRFALELPTRSYADWPYDVHSRELFERIAARPRPAGRRLRVLTSPFHYEPALNFYRLVRGADWLAPVERTRRGLGLDALAGFDLLVLSPDLVGDRGLRALLGEVLYRDPLTGITLATPAR